MQQRLQQNQKQNDTWYFWLCLLRSHDLTVAVVLNTKQACSKLCMPSDHAAPPDLCLKHLPQTRDYHKL